MKTELFYESLNLPKSNNSSSMFHQLLAQPAFRYLGEDGCPFKIKNRFSELVDEICSLWGHKIRKQHKRWLLIALNNSRSFENIDEKLATIEKTLSKCGYCKIRDKRIKAIKKLGLTRGYIYVLSNEFMRGIVKIGMTKSPDRSGDDRARELSTTGVPGNFSVEFQRITFNPHDAEDRILSNFEYYLKDKRMGERVSSGNNLKQELFYVRKKDYVSIAVSYVQRALKNHEKSISDKIYLEIEREKILIEVLNRAHTIIQNGASKEVLRPVTDDLKIKVQYLSQQRQLNELFPSINSSGIAFYLAVNHCIEWLDFLLKNTEIDNSISSKLKSHILISIKNTIGLLPKSLQVSR